MYLVFICFLFVEVFNRVLPPLLIAAQTSKGRSQSSSLPNMGNFILERQTTHQTAKSHTNVGIQRQNRRDYQAILFIYVRIVGIFGSFAPSAVICRTEPFPPRKDGSSRNKGTGARHKYRTRHVMAFWHVVALIPADISIKYVDVLK